MTPGAPRGERALPVLAGGLLALAFPPAAFLLPSFVALAPLLLFIDERPPGAAGRWSATRAALVTGLVFFGLRLYWFVVALGDRSLLAIPAWALTVVVLALPVAAFGWALHLVRERLPVPLPVAAAVLWTAAEWVHGHLGPFAFPWLPLGTSLAPFPILAGAADLGGVPLLSFWLAAVNGCVAALLAAARRGRPLPALVGTTAILALLAPAYGALRAATLELRPVARVAVLQPAISTTLRRDSTRAVDASLRTLTALTRRVAGEGLDLVVWPEVAVPAALEMEPALQARLAGTSRQTGAPLLVGAYGVRILHEDVTWHNAAFRVDPDGVLPGPYAKRVLVPFVERVPFRAAARTGAEPHYGGLTAGEDGPLFRTASGATYGILICFESAFARLARGYRSGGADFLVSMSNDAWFSRDAWYGRTTAVWQHPAHLVLRAIETRAGVARAANMGFSLFIDPLGRVYGRTEADAPAARAAVVLTTDAVPLAVRWGDWVGRGAVGLALLLVSAALMSGSPAGIFPGWRVTRTRIRA